MEENVILAMYILISILISLIFNLLFYHMIFRSKKRMYANFLSWLSTLGLMLLSNYGLVFVLLNDVDSGLAWLTGFPLLMLIVIAPLLWFIPVTVYSLIRIIYIVITKDKEREILESSYE
ncbi:MAG: hypothetical protein ACFFDW_02840, partial [Candidatus Thorarchaeota archaeon]